MAFLTRRRLIVVAVVLGVALTVGVVMSFRAAVTVVLVAVTFWLLSLGTRYAQQHGDEFWREVGQERFGQNDGKKR